MEPTPKAEPTPVAATESEPEAARHEVVLVRLGGSRYALALSSIAEVGRPPEVTRVPGLPSWVSGLVNWRGRVLAVLDLRPLLGVPAQAFTRHCRLVVLDSAGVRAGVLVDAVEGTVSYEPEAMDTVPGHLDPQAAGLLAGQVTQADGPFAVLSVDALMRLSDRLPRGRRTG